MDSRLLIGDCLEVLPDLPEQSVDLVYADPPFCTQRDWGAFTDQWKGGLDEYLVWMKPRLQAIHRVLKPTGSLYLHCDDNASHYLKVMLDDLFGRQNYKNEMVWLRTPGVRIGLDKYSRVHDYILYYAFPDAVYNQQYIPLSDNYVNKTYTQQDDRGQYAISRLSTDGTSNGLSGQEWRGVNPTITGHHWWTPCRGQYSSWIKNNIISDWPEGYPDVFARLDALDNAGLIYWPPLGRIPRLKYYLQASLGVAVSDMILDINNIQYLDKDNTGYPTQKPIRLLERLILSSTNPGDIVLDTFCGSGTSLVAAEKHHRKWIGIDVNPDVKPIIEDRLTNLQPVLQLEGG